MPVVDKTKVVTLEEVEEAFRQKPWGLGYCSDESDEFPAKLGFDEPWMRSSVFVHIRKLKELGKLRRHQADEKEKRPNRKNPGRNVWRYWFEYTERPWCFSGYSEESRSSDYFVR